MLFIGLMILAVLFIADIAMMIKGMDEWKEKIDAKQGPKKAVWLLVFYMVTALCIILTVVSLFG